jgi:hypothetical protein
MITAARAKSLAHEREPPLRTRPASASALMSRTRRLASRWWQLPLLGLQPPPHFCRRLTTRSIHRRGHPAFLCHHCHGPGMSHLICATDAAHSEGSGENGAAAVWAAVRGRDRRPLRLWELPPGRAASRPSLGQRRIQGGHGGIAQGVNFLSQHRPLCHSHPCQRRTFRHARRRLERTRMYSTATAATASRSVCGRSSSARR